MRYTLGRLAMFGSLLVWASSASAHHALQAQFNTLKPLELKGTLARVDWVNPHALIYLDATDENGKVEKWIAETNSPNTLSRQGWNKNTVKVGDQITLVGHRVKGGGNYINFSKITWPDGRVLTPAIQN